MRFREVFMMLMAVVMVGLMSPCVQAMAVQDSQDDLKARFEKRYPLVAKLLDQGAIGETWQGFLEVVKSNAKIEDDAKKLMAEENADRKKLYELLAAQTVQEGKRKLTAEQVGERNGRRKFQEAKSHWHLKVKDGNVWFQRNEVAALKKSGKIGETWDGNIGAISDDAAKDAQVKRVVSAENQVRTSIYRKEARESEKPQESVAEAAGSKNIANAKAGEYIKRKGGEWEKKK